MEMRPMIGHTRPTTSEDSPYKRAPSGYISILTAKLPPLTGPLGGELASQPSDVLVAGYDSMDEHLGSTSLGGARVEYASGARYTASGEPWVVGQFTGVLDHGSGALAADGNAVFVLRFAGSQGHWSLLSTRLAFWGLATV
jgi:hypothetical protein